MASSDKRVRTPKKTLQEEGTTMNERINDAKMPIARKAAFLSGVIALCCCLAIALASCGSPAQETKTDEGGEKIAVKIIVDSSAAKNEASFDKTLDLPAGTTVFEALEATGLDIEVTSSSMSDYVSGIAGLAEKDYGDASGWIFTVNDEYITETADQRKLEDGDTVKWEYLTTFE